MSAVPDAAALAAPQRMCVVIPTYDNPKTIRNVVEAVRRTIADVIVVDDASGDEGRLACAALADEGLIELVRRDVNGERAPP